MVGEENIINYDCQTMNNLVVRLIYTINMKVEKRLMSFNYVIVN